MEWHAHPLGIGTKLQLFNAAILSASMFGPTGPVILNSLLPMDKSHHAVLVYFFCGACRMENRHTYDFSSDGKESRWGYYGRSLGICAETKLNVSYEKVEDIFRVMWTKYSLHGGNCKDWASDFYNRVNDKSKEFPPISHLLDINGRKDLINNLTNYLKYPNENAIKHVGKMLSNLGLDNITIAVRKAAEQNIICRCCRKQIEHLDELCYCPDSDTKCHHGTG
uniref:Uncharacterized protein n=1 Tax=Globodera rostochiensis TaxID=31243 RepID=A0A914IGP9_GLORO